MKFEFTSASEAKAVAEDSRVVVTDEHYSQMVRGINRQIGHAAEVGEFECKVRVDDLFNMAELFSLREEYRKTHVHTIINDLREAGYTAELSFSYAGPSYLHIVISW